MDLPIACPTCRAPVAVLAAQRPASFPFCCERCRLMDLGRWADGERRIPGRSLASVASEAEPSR